MTNSLDECRRSWKRNPGLQLASLLVLVASFSLLVSSFLLSKNFFMLLTQWGAASNVSVYLTDAATESEVKQVSEHLESLSALENIRFFTKADAVSDFSERFSHLLPDLVDDPEIQSVLPASFEATVASSMVGESVHKFLTGLSKELKAFAGVESVTFGEDWLKDYASVLNIVRFIGLLFAAVIFIGTLFITGNTIRSSIYSRSEEIAVLELIGATSTMIRRPFVIEGTLFGGFAMVVALLFCFACYSWAQAVIAQELAFSGLKGEITFFSAFEIIAMLLAGVGLGALGSYMTARNLNTGWLASEA